MFVVRFGGGLGNQLYQYALALVLHERYPNVPIKCDISSYKFVNEHEGFEIPNLFAFEFETVNQDELKKYCPIHSLALAIRLDGFINNKLSRYMLIWNLDKLYRIIQDQKKVFGRITDSHLGGLNTSILFLKKTDRIDYYFEGAWQNVGYFSDHEGLLRAKLSISYKVSNKELTDLVQRDDTVGIHIRGNDFYINQRLNICGQGYYNKAIECIKTKIKEPFFIIITDDIRRSGEIGKILKLKNVRVICGKAYDDFILLKSCKNKIISNSTFSFWAAYLSEQNDGITIAPMFSVKEKKRYITSSLPEKWIRIDNRKFE